MEVKTQSPRRAPRQTRWDSSAQGDSTGTSARLDGQRDPILIRRGNNNNNNNKKRKIIFIQLLKGVLQDAGSGKLHSCYSSDLCSL